MIMACLFRGMYVRLLARKKLKLETDTTTSTASSIGSSSSLLSLSPGQSPSLVGTVTPTKVGLTRKPLTTAGSTESPGGRKVAAKLSTPGTKQVAGKTAKGTSGNYV